MGFMSQEEQNTMHHEKQQEEAAIKTDLYVLGVTLPVECPLKGQLKLFVNLWWTSLGKKRLI